MNRWKPQENMENIINTRKEIIYGNSGCETSKNILLINPPVTNITLPAFLGIASIKALIKERFPDINIECLDLNIESFNYILENNSFLETTFKIINLKKKRNIELEELVNATSFFKCEDFFDFGLYLKYQKTFNKYLFILSEIYHPLDLSLESFSYPPKFEIPLDSNPFFKIWYNSLEKRIKNTKIVGISICNTSQLNSATSLSRIIKKMNPYTKIVFGGPVVTKICSYYNNLKKRLFEYSDYLVVGDGETTFLSLVEHLFDKKEFPLTNIYSINKGTTKLIKEPSKLIYEDINNLPPPDFDDVTWEKYYSPTKAFLFAPSRGCYWSKCTFCSYGYSSKNKMPSKYRTISPEKALKQIRYLKQKYNVNNFLFAIDTLDSKWMDKFSSLILKEKVYWSVETRAERGYTLNIAKKLKNSGLVEITFGIESGNKRILNEMQKGTDLETYVQCLYNFYINDIATSVNSFTHFPTESFEESIDTLHFLSKNKDKISMIGCWWFGLYIGSHIFEQPHKFNIDKITSTNSLFEYNYSLKKNKISKSQNDILNNLKKDIICGNSYPFCGYPQGFHTQLYLIRYGKIFFKKIQEDIEKHLRLI